jgi:hypothetical protein
MRRRRKCVSGLLYTLTEHGWYAWIGVGLILLLGLQAYFKFQVEVLPDYLGSVGLGYAPLRPGKHWFPYQYIEVRMTPRMLPIELDELQTTQRTDTYRDGDRQGKESVVVRQPAHPNKGIVISYIPDEDHLVDYLLNRHNVEDKLRTLVLLDRSCASLGTQVSSLRLGITIVNVWGASAGKKDSGVSLADDVEIPYEG